ncbi:MAG: 30S ribosome-binding factor RbfA [Alphaproteobacteria bacterium]|nr:30S ribosome-binding factor RbfA [Alphaproteobacteria bacterium]MBV9198177.1 30S ribosome-binding factor RbfA [Alphaproteobacteria bacterium]MBV9378019.1 30S ribosome-binding factor RbfA [Alphaproteobacteria bacterium]
MVKRRRSRQQPKLGGAEYHASQRQLRVGEELRHVLARILRDGECRDPALDDASITVTEVRLSPDLRSATAFVMPLGGANAAEVVAALRRCAVFLKGVLAREVQLRNTPNLIFALDGSFDEAARISALLARPEVARDLEPHAPSPRNEC